ncbi:hypothetical protein ACEN8I_06930 [Polaromonas sp. CT11-55]|uniref:hypothetical protein n=1 Tax=Polaromonas sp. CT11-55 TaxID=3243045 RepID=UPI0039A50306
MKRLAMLVSTAAAFTVLSACGEKPQTLGSGARSDTAAFQGTDNAFAAPGWTKGDKASWEQGLKARMQNSQNEYTKTGTSK